MENTINIVSNVGGVSFRGDIARDASGQIGQEITATAGQPGSLDTRTDNDTGVVGADNVSHGIVSTDKIDLYWTNSDGTIGRRVGMTATVSGQNVTLDGGSGDNLPALNSTVRMGRRTTVDVDFVADLAELIVAGCKDAAATVLFMASSAVQHTVELLAAEPWIWWDAFANPMTGDTIDEIQVSVNADAATTVKLGILYASA